VSNIPNETIRVFARTIFNESHRYGFGGIDFVRLINALMDMTTDQKMANGHATLTKTFDEAHMQLDAFPLKSSRLQIRLADPDRDKHLIETWIGGRYGAYFLLSCATAQQHDVASLLANANNQIGIIAVGDGKPVGAVAYLDIDHRQRRAELRKLIGDDGERGKGYAEEATALWVAYGRKQLGLEKIYLSTLQTHLSNIRLNESIGFRTEGVLRGEILLGDKRHDVLRMGLCFEPDAGAE
jgi:RimJ/RimL family protein N-acetyltransferase